MYQEELNKMIEQWEPSQYEGFEIVRTIDTHDDTVERVVKYRTRHPHTNEMGVLYSLYRYFTLGDRPEVHVSVDLQEVSADRVIQHLAERL